MRHKLETLFFVHLFQPQESVNPSIYWVSQRSLSYLQHESQVNFDINGPFVFH